MTSAEIKMWLRGLALRGELAVVYPLIGNAVKAWLGDRTVRAKFESFESYLLSIADHLEQAARALRDIVVPPGPPVDGAGAP